MARCLARSCLSMEWRGSFWNSLRDDPGRGSVFGGAMSGTQLIAIGLVRRRADLVAAAGGEECYGAAGGGYAVD